MNNKEQKEFDEFFDKVGTDKKKPYPVLIPLIRRFYPNRLARWITSVQPMNSKEYDETVYDETVRQIERRLRGNKK